MLLARDLVENLHAQLVDLWNTAGELRQEEQQGQLIDKLKRSGSSGEVPARGRLLREHQHLGINLVARLFIVCAHAEMRQL